MITKITGKLVTVGEDAVGLEVGPFEYEVLVPHFVQTQLQGRRGEDVTLFTLDYLEGNPAHGRLVPRLVGFRTEVEREFFELFCSVDGVGHRKALRALACNVRDLARVIHEKDATAVATLPGIGEATADRVVAKLHRKTAKFALMVTPEAPETPLEPDLHQEALEALVALGYREAEAARLLASITGTRRKLKTVEDILGEIYNKNPGG